MTPPQRISVYRVFQLDGAILLGVLLCNSGSGNVRVVVHWLLFTITILSTPVVVLCFCQSVSVVWSVVCHW